MERKGIIGRVRIVFQQPVRLISISTRVRRYCPKPCWCPLWIGCKLTCVCVVSDRSAISATTIVALKEPGLEQAFGTCQRGDRRHNVRRNEAKDERNRADRRTIVEGIERQLKKATRR